MTSKLTRLVRFTEIVTSWFNRFGLYVTIPIMMVSITGNVILRKFFNAPVQGADVISDYLLLTLIFLSIAYCWVEGGHVKVELVQDRLGTRKRAATEALGAAAGLAFFLAIAIQGTQAMTLSLRTMEVTQDIDIYVWPFKLIMAIGSSLMCLVLFYSVISSINRVLKG